jgi:hypothetical protein
VDKFSPLIGGIVLLLIALDAASIILTGKARAFRWIGQQAKKAITAIWRWFWKTLWRAVRGILQFIWRQVRAFFCWLFNSNNQQGAQGGNP